MIQLQFLNYILSNKDPGIIEKYNLNDNFFSDYTSEFLYIKNHISIYGIVPDKVSFLSKFPNFDVIDVTDSESYLVNALFEDKNKRFLVSTFNNIRQYLMDDKTEEAVAYYLNSSKNISEIKPTSSVDILEDVSRYDDYVDRSQDFSKYYVRTGFKELDELIGGWDKQEELVTIVARPGVGKSWVLLKCAVSSLEQGMRVGLFSGEMSSRKVGYRFDTLVSHISNGAIMRGNATVMNPYKKYIEELNGKYTGCFKVLTPDMVNGSVGVSALRAFVEKENLDILFVDQHSLLDDDSKAKNAVERASNISKDLKKLQVMKKIPIIAVSQQNRTEYQGAGPTTANVAQTDRISQDSTIIIFLEQKDGVMTVSLVKARDSVNDKKLKYACDLDKGIFNYIPIESNGDAEKCDDLKKEYEYEEPVGESVF